MIAAAQDNANDGDEEDGNFNLENLFTNETYIEKSFVFEGKNDDTLVQKLLCSPMSMTDHDLTGQIVWPASILLSYFIVANKGSIFNDKKVVYELGAGCGLAGFVATNYCKHVLISDGNDIVMRLLKKNKDFLSSTNTSNCDVSCAVSIEKLTWGRKPDVIALIDQLNTVYNDARLTYPDVIIGADIILWPNEVRSLLLTLLWLLSYKPTCSVAYISYVVRAKSTTKILFEIADELGLVIEQYDCDDYLPSPVPSNLLMLEKYIFKVSIAPALASKCRLRDIIHKYDGDGTSGESNLVYKSLAEDNIDSDMSDYIDSNSAAC